MSDQRAAATTVNTDATHLPEISPEEMAGLVSERTSPDAMAVAEAGPDAGFEATMRPHVTLPEAETGDTGGEAAALVATGTLPTGNLMYDPEISFYGIAIRPEEVGPQAEQYEAAAVLEAGAELVNLFITEDLLKKTWSKIEALENEITVSREISTGAGYVLLDRLRAARNFLLHHRDRYEEAQQEIAQVDFRFTRIRKIEWFEKPPLIFGWLVLVTVALAVVAAWGVGQLGGLEAVLARMSSKEVSTASTLSFIIAIWAGGLGGVTVGFYSLWRHVAQLKDYDPEFALWYYVNPIMGLLLGVFVFMFSNANIVQFTTNWAVFLLAYAVGFQQQLVFGILNGIVNRLLPSKLKSEAEAAGQNP
ncbi:MAG: hypothetical protein RMK99_03340 [Anaerolineales bacterium]|nr:hypothetical protein [Anaerolineales bacterium]